MGEPRAPRIAQDPDEPDQGGTKRMTPWINAPGVKRSTRAAALDRIRSRGDERHQSGEGETARHRPSPFRAPRCAAVDCPAGDGGHHREPGPDQHQSRAIARQQCRVVRYGEGDRRGAPEQWSPRTRAAWPAASAAHALWPLLGIAGSRLDGVADHAAEERDHTEIQDRPKTM